MEAIKFNKSIAELYDLMQMQDGYVKTLYDDYILIEKQGVDKLYTWGIFSMSAWIDDYDGEYDYVLTNLTCYARREDDNYGCFFFPIYAMARPLLHWKGDKTYAFNMIIDELAEFYTLHGFAVEVAGNVLKVSTPITTDAQQSTSGYDTWEITFHSDGTVSAGNFLSYQATDCF